MEATKRFEEEMIKAMVKETITFEEAQKIINEKHLQSILTTSRKSEKLVFDKINKVIITKEKSDKIKADKETKEKKKAIKKEIASLEKKIAELKAML